MFQTTRSIQMHHLIHFSKSLPTLSKFQFKHITQMFTFSREIWEFSSGYTKIESGSLWSNKSSYSKAKSILLLKKKKTLFTWGQKDWEVSEMMGNSEPTPTNLYYESSSLSGYTKLAKTRFMYLLNFMSQKKRNCLFP